LGDAGLLSAALVSLGYEFLLQGDHERATALNAEAAALLRGDDEQARDLLKESLALSGELGDGLNAAESLDGLACTAAARGEAGRAARLFGAAEALREAMGIPLPSAARALREPYTRAARSRLDEVEWTRRWEEGRAMSQEEAVALALKDERD